MPTVHISVYYVLISATIEQNKKGEAKRTEQRKRDKEETRRLIYGKAGHHNRSQIVPGDIG